MKLETRMRQSINRRHGIVLSRSDVASLGSKTQVSYVLNLLVKQGELIRISHGVYVKAKKVSENNIKAQGSLDVIIREVAKKWSIVLHQKALSATYENISSGEVVVETETPGVERKFLVNGTAFLFRCYHNNYRGRKNISPLAKALPTQNVANYVLELARYYNISYHYNSMDRWANAVTRLAGDEVKHDDIEDLLVALKRAGKITKSDVAMLAVNYLRERKQSVRSL